MNIPDIFRRGSRSTEAQEQPTPDDEGTPTSDLEWDTSTSALASRSISGFLMACLVAGPVALLLALLLLSTPPPQQQVAAPIRTGTVGERAAVSAFAEDFVSTWLTSRRGEEAALESFLGAIPQVDLPDRSWRVSNPTTADLVKTESGVWSVTVSATTWTSSTTRTRRYFVVPVAYTDGALVASALPAPAAAPLTGQQQETIYQYQAPSSSSVTKAINDFLAALLAGSGDLTRFISPGAQIRPVTPPAYPMGVQVTNVLLDVELTDMDENPATGRTLHALVSASGSAGPEQATPIQYPLTLVAREGRWEIASIDPAPLVPTAEPSGSGETSTTN